MFDEFLLKHDAVQHTACQECRGNRPPNLFGSENQTTSQPAQLRAHLKTRHPAQGQRLPKVDDKAPKNWMEKMVSKFQSIGHPAILLSDAHPTAHAAKFLDLTLEQDR